MTTGLFSPLGKPPAGWRLAQLRDITSKIGSGATPLGGASVYLPTRHRYALIRSQNVFDRRFEAEDLAFIEDNAAQRLSSAEVHPGDILLNITGDGVTFSRSCMAPADALPACVNQHVAIIRAVRDQCSPGYLLAYLTHPAIKAYIASFNTGASRRAVTKSAIESFVLPLPPIATQLRIAECTTAYDELIENNTKRARILEDMARSLYREWFVDFRLPQSTSEPLVTSPVVDAPKGWRVGPLEEIVSLQRGFDITKAQQRSGPYPVISSSGPGSTHDEYMSEGPGVIIGRKGSLGTVFFSEGPYWPHDTTLWVTNFHGNGPWYCYHLLRHLKLEQYDCGASNPTLNRNHIHKLLVPIPPRELTVEFDRRVSSLMRLARVLADKNSTLRRQRDLLLPRLLSGDIDVSSLPLDPAA